MPSKLPPSLTRTLTLTHLSRPPLHLPYQSSLPPWPPCHNLPPPSSSSSTSRPLSTTPPRQKSGGKQSSKRTIPHNASIAKATSPSPNNPPGAFDFSDYDAAIARAHEQLKSELGRINAGGKVDPEAVEGLKVVIAKSGGGGGKVGKAGGSGSGVDGGKEGTWARLGDLASVIPRGRNLVILVGEKEHVKPITAALTHSSSPTSTSMAMLNLPPPQSSPTDPLTLTIPIPPTTRESRVQAQSLASKKGEEVLFMLREARGSQRKQLRRLELGRMIGPDECRRVEREMEGRNEGAVKEVKGMVERCRRALEG